MIAITVNAANAVNAVNAVNQDPTSLATSQELEILMPSRPSQPSSGHVSEIVSVDQAARQRLRDLLLEGASSDKTSPVGASYFDSLRDRAQKASN